MDAAEQFSQAADAFPLSLALLASARRDLGQRHLAEQSIAALERLSRSRSVSALTCDVSARCRWRLRHE